MTENPVDGRTARARRTQRAIVDALLELIEEGDLSPTAPRIAERAAVSLRSIYQHFEDLEALFGAAATRQLERILGMASPIPPTGALDERLSAFVRQRGRVLEAMTPVRRAALLQEPFSQQLKESRRSMQNLGRAEIGRVFAAELDRLPPTVRKEVQAGLETASTWSSWDHLRSTGLSCESSRRIMRRMMHALLITNETAEEPS
jgi:TetR/AcrR family transcriptional regulator of autoinduction and epiphytic fitness